jgi:enoyl-CoA hydratase
MSITGNYIDAATAQAWGLVNEVVAHDDLLARCRELAADVVSNDQAGVRRMLQTYNEVTATTVDEGWAIEARVSREWEGPGFDPASIEARRKGVMERGRSQIAK